MAGVLGAPRRSARVPGEPRRLAGVPEAPRSSTVVPGEPRMLEEVSGAPGRSAWGLRSGKEVTAGARKEDKSRSPANFMRTVTRCNIVPSAITRSIFSKSGKVKGAIRFRRGSGG